MCKSCRTRQELSNKYLLAKIGFDTAENGPLKVCQELANCYSLKKVRTHIGAALPPFPHFEARPVQLRNAAHVPDDQELGRGADAPRLSAERLGGRLRYAALLLGALQLPLT